MLLKIPYESEGCARLLTGPRTSDSVGIFCVHSDRFFTAREGMRGNLYSFIHYPFCMRK
ncbi:MAG: hypothetical protein UX58_C0002G0214 [Candidatus Wolfebacteria bacterium GW2011_GWB2_46_69]|uniref:Uncharacterized protein n=1 Tax=Candidatus Wolfebacteria bacterium GW2011_GWA2_47_9b TaxID=1619005 RepID=A0A0G1X4W7_9BACT|nr:MAG: hypothetical protein UX58_C0002G0214 [Candidatus Wolfebacteria bacterium GW2011_GWB2_46_69]KKU59653.1 MAG: hypothetical protein UX83_C0003G0068 [Candidatus Wolfebacteria bacterium GW2011_GWE2_47_12]KKU66297.1 MAG: hypothetical protein UX90_C0001G0356 [Candidatus Wolfebacteria bacterium GW2011_GWD2_47_17]KKU76545.1 MAG: hypothetical protein UY00_C0008G0003 [Candidatus Wolfebacteria bacterium GW2011_GWA1_47_6]KKU89480.1 MAG: hypothetical protein UY19_C0014G0080 [Candidatus Wolfebacteria b